ncbi:hypothetical protein [Jatrophihabitans sp.]|uniref:hypothetical protein n=1 Tax=Jatrophihabitans sp. TaxID=1932789 RepID=UPI002BA020E9|nr:hypothetical protein [Jatrophihabitans sp.]
MAGEEFRATLRGSEAALGTVRASDIARLITGLESAVAAAAYAALGKPRKGSTGRHRAAIEAASRLRFQNIESGSVVAVLRLPRLAETTDDTLNVEVDDLAGAAFDRIVAAFAQADDQVDPGIARTLADLAQELGIGERHEELVLTSPRTTSAGHLDASAKERMRRLADAPLGHQPDVVVGTLREADFDRRTARLHAATGETVTVKFPAELDDEIQEALRAQAAFEGIITFDPNTATIKRVDLRRINTSEPLPFDASAFWTTSPLEDLAQIQGVQPATFDAPFGEWNEQEIADIVSALADLDA